MSTERISYVPTENGRFVRYPYARRTSSNRFVEIGRLFYNVIVGIFQFTNFLHYSITTFNNMLASLPFFVRHFIHAILAVCFPFYSIYQGLTKIINQIHRIVYPIYRAITFVTRIFAFFITLPMRIIAFIPTLLQDLLKNLLIILILVGFVIGLLVLFSNEEQLNTLKSYVRNTTDMLLKQCSMI